MTFTEHVTRTGNPPAAPVSHTAPPCMNTVLRSIALVVTLAAASLLHAQDGPEPTDAEKTFFRELKRAALAGDRAWVTAHVCFPVRAMVEGRTRVIANAEEFEAAYAQIMTLETVNAIRRQAPDALVRTRQGVMVGDGEVWLGENPAGPAGAQPKVCVLAFGNSG